MSLPGGIKKSIISRKAPASQEVLLKSFMNDPSKSDLLPTLVYPINPLSENQAPLAPIERPGHFEFLPTSLHPNEDIKAIVPLNELEKSSSSFLNDIPTPPSSGSEEEMGKVGFQCFCFGKRKRFQVTHAYRDRTEADKFGSVLLFFTMITFLPTFLFQMFYVFWTTFRVAMLANYYYCIWIFITAIFVYFVLKYFSGLARHYPFHLIMIASKTLCFLILYNLCCVLVEAMVIYKLVYADPRLEEIEDEDLSGDFYLMYIVIGNNATRSSFSHIQDDEVDEFWHELYEESLQEELIHITPNLVFFFGISYGLFLMIVQFLLIISSRTSFFGPTYSFINYTTTCIIMLIFVCLILDQETLEHSDILVVDRTNFLWVMFQSVAGPAIGCYMAEGFLDYLDNLFAGNYCPIRSYEFFYALVQYY